MRVIVMLGLAACGGGAKHPAYVPKPAPNIPVSFPQTCDAIARDIEALVPEYPQLANYRAADQQHCHISYSYKTVDVSDRSDMPTQRAGYRGGLPDVEPDGVFLYIGIWDPKDKYNSQLDMQVSGIYEVGDRRVTFLLFEGEQTKKLSAEVQRIFERRGVYIP